MATLAHFNETAKLAASQFAEVSKRMRMECRDECNAIVAERLSARLVAVYMNHLQDPQIKVEIQPLPEEDWDSIPIGGNLVDPDDSEEGEDSSDAKPSAAEDPENSAKPFFSQVSENTSKIKVPDSKVIAAIVSLAADTSVQCDNLALLLTMTDAYLAILPGVSEGHHKVHQCLSDRFADVRNAEILTGKTGGETVPSTETGVAAVTAEQLVDSLGQTVENVGLELVARIEELKFTALRDEYSRYDVKIGLIMDTLRSYDDVHSADHIRQQTFIEYTLMKLNDYRFTGLLETSAFEGILDQTTTKVNTVPEGDNPHLKQVEILEEYLRNNVNARLSDVLTTMFTNMDLTNVPDDMAGIVQQLRSLTNPQADVEELVIGKDNDETPTSLFGCAKNMLIKTQEDWEQEAADDAPYLAATRVFDVINTTLANDIPFVHVILLPDREELRLMQLTIDECMAKFETDTLVDLVPQYAVKLAELVTQTVQTLFYGCYRGLEWRQSVVLAQGRTPQLDNATALARTRADAVERRLKSLQTLDALVATHDALAVHFVQDIAKDTSLDNPWPLEDIDESVIGSDDPSDLAAAEIVFAWAENRPLTFCDIFKQLAKIFPDSASTPEASTNQVLSMALTLLSQNAKALDYGDDEEEDSSFLEGSPAVREPEDPLVSSLKFAIKRCTEMSNLGFDEVEATNAWRALLSSEDRCKAIDQACAGDFSLIVDFDTSADLTAHVREKLTATIGPLESPKNIWELNLDVAKIESFSRYIRYYGDAEVIERVLSVPNVQGEDFLAETKRRVLQSAESYTPEDPVDETVFAHLNLHLTLGSWVATSRSESLSSRASGSARAGVVSSSEILGRLKARAQETFKAAKKSPNILLGNNAGTVLKVDLFELLKQLMSITPYGMTDPNVLLKQFVDMQQSALASPKPQCLQV